TVRARVGGTAGGRGRGDRRRRRVGGRGFAPSPTAPAAGSPLAGDGGVKLRDVPDEHVRSLVRRVVAGRVVDVPPRDVGVVTLGEAADGQEVVRRGGEGDRDGRRAVRRVVGPGHLVVEADRRAGGPGQPVQGDVGDDELVVGPDEQLTVPAQQTGRRVGERVGQRLRRLGLQDVERA